MGGYSAVGGLESSWLNNPIFKNGIWSYDPVSIYCPGVPVIKSDQNGTLINSVHLYCDKDIVFLNKSGIDGVIIQTLERTFNLGGVADHIVEKISNSSSDRVKNRNNLYGELISIADLQTILTKEIGSYRKK